MSLLIKKNTPVLYINRGNRFVDGTVVNILENPRLEVVPCDKFKPEIVRDKSILKYYDETDNTWKFYKYFKTRNIRLKRLARKIKRYENNNKKEKK